MDDLRALILADWRPIYYLFLFVVIFISSIAFMVSYHWRAPWWRSDEGRDYMVLAASLALLSGHVLISRLFPNYPGRVWVLFGGLTAIAAMSVWRLVIFWRAQRDNR